MCQIRLLFALFFLLNDPSTTQIYTLSLHDALPISISYVEFELKRALSEGGPLVPPPVGRMSRHLRHFPLTPEVSLFPEDRKSTRLNSSHVEISYAVFCLKKKRLTIPTYVHFKWACV